LDDYREFNRHVGKKLSARIRSGALTLLSTLFLAMPILFFISAYSCWDDQRERELGWYGVVFTPIAWFVVFIWFGRMRVKLWLAESLLPDGNFLATKTFAYSNSGFSVRQPHSSQTCEWPLIKALHKSKNLIYLHLDNIQAICIPFRAFPSTEDAEDFYDFVDRRIAPSS
jgi:hypothetical protein